MMKTFPIFVFILAALGLLVTLRRRWREFLLIYFVILMTVGECIIYYGIPRFRAPIEPMLILLGAGAIWWMTHREPGTMWWMLNRLRKKEEFTTAQADEAEISPSSSEPVAQ